MNDDSMATYTLGDQAENHAGMEILGQMVPKGQGFNRDDLINIKNTLHNEGIDTELIDLDLFQNYNDIDFSIEPPEPAYLLVIRDGVNKLLQKDAQYNQYQMFNEHCVLEHDKHAWMKGRVVNKHARWNLCFDDYNRDPDYENKMGRIVAFHEVPITLQLMRQIEHYFGPKAHNLKGEGNYYFDKTKCGIGFHGDTERRKVIGVRLGVGISAPLHYQWFYHSEPVGERIIIPLNAGDIYVMSEKAVGQDWKKHKIFTLRHATGSHKFVST